MAVHRLGDAEAEPGQAGGLRGGRDGDDDRHLPGDGGDGVPVEPELEGREVREAGGEQEAAGGGYEGEPGDRGAGEVTVAEWESASCVRGLFASCWRDVVGCS